MIIEEAIIEYLNSYLTGYMTYTETPEDSTQEYFLIQRTGGDEVNHIRHSIVAIQSISSVSMLSAAEMNEMIKALIKAMPDHADIYSAKLNSDYNFTNTQTKQYRYQAVYDFYY